MQYLFPPFALLSALATLAAPVPNAPPVSFNPGTPIKRDHPDRPHGNGIAIPIQHQTDAPDTIKPTTVIRTDAAGAVETHVRIGTKEVSTGDKVPAKVRLGAMAIALDKFNGATAGQGRKP